MMQERDVIAWDGEFIAGGSHDRTVPAVGDRTQSAQGPRYHALTTDVEGGQSLHALPAYGDDEAIALALALADGHAVEVWDGPRLVERFDAAKR